MEHPKVLKYTWNTLKYRTIPGTPESTELCMEHPKVKTHTWNTLKYGTIHGTP